MTRSFGPAVIHGDNDTFRATCSYCIFRRHKGGETNICSHSAHAQREIPDPENTPEWCLMLGRALRDARDMASGVEHVVVRWSGRKSDEPWVMYQGIPSEAERQFRLAAAKAKRGTVRLLGTVREELARHPDTNADSRHNRREFA